MLYPAGIALNVIDAAAEASTCVAYAPALASRHAAPAPVPPVVQTQTLPPGRRRYPRPSTSRSAAAR